MPQTIYLPRKHNPWEQLLPQLVGQMAMAKYRQSLMDPNLVPSGGKNYMRWDRKKQEFVESKVPMPQNEVAEKGAFTQLDTFEYGGNSYRVQQGPDGRRYYKKIEGEGKGGKDGGKGTRVDLTPSEIESRKQNLIRNFGHARDSMGQIIEMNKREKMPKLMNWFRSRDKEGKLKKIPGGELDLAEEAIMADLRIDQAIQDNIKHLRRVGATTPEIIQLLKEEMKSTTRKLR